jgi:hypothetical protein
MDFFIIFLALVFLWVFRRYLRWDLEKRAKEKAEAQRIIDSWPWKG